MNLLFVILSSTILFSCVLSWRPDKKQRVKKMYWGGENYEEMWKQYKVYEAETPHNYIPSKTILYKIQELKDYDLNNVNIVKEVIFENDLFLSTNGRDDFPLPAYIKYTVTPKTKGNFRPYNTFFMIIIEPMDKKKDFKIKRVYKIDETGKRLSFSWVVKKELLLQTHDPRHNKYDCIAELLDEFNKMQPIQMHETCEQLGKYTKTKTDTKFGRLDEWRIYNESPCYLAADDHTFLLMPGYLWCSITYLDKTTHWKYYAYNLKYADWVEVHYDYASKPTHDGLPLLSIENMRDWKQT